MATGGNRISLTDDVKRSMLNRNSRKSGKRSLASKAERTRHQFDGDMVCEMAEALRDVAEHDSPADFPKRTQLSFRLDDATADRLRIASAVHKISMQDMWTLAADLLVASFDEMGTVSS